MQKEGTDNLGLDVFLSYAHQDEALRNELETHLSTLKRQGSVRAWTDRRIVAGQEWDREIDANLESANLVLLLISPAFVASDYCWGIELKRALERHEAREAQVIPIILRAADWESTPFSKLQALPQGGKPLTSWSNQDEAFLSVTRGLRAILAEETRRRTRVSTLLTRLSVHRFSVFENVQLDFCPGLNVLIGLNGTGKTHLMKLMYSLLNGWASSLREGVTEAVAASLLRKLTGVFQPEERNITRLIRRAEETAMVELEYEQGRLQLTLEQDDGLILSTNMPEVAPSSTIFIPAREVLSMYEGFVAAYESRELSFDETFYDLCVALSARPLREDPTGATDFLDPLEDILGGRVRLRGNRFYVESGENRTEAHLLAEGMRKIAVLAYLIRNGSLGRSSILFWDEPETNLNPRLITKIAETLHQLARSGTQVVIATHDYLLSHELSLMAEYDVTPGVESRFFSFYQEELRGAVHIESASTLVGIDHNPILEEYAAHHEREQSLFRQSLTSGNGTKA